MISPGVLPNVDPPLLSSDSSESPGCHVTAHVMDTSQLMSWTRHSSCHGHVTAHVMDTSQLMSWSRHSSCHDRHHVIVTSQPCYVTAMLWSRHSSRHGHVTAHAMVRYSSCLGYVTAYVTSRHSSCLGYVRAHTMVTSQLRVWAFEFRVEVDARLRLPGSVLWVHISA